MIKESPVQSHCLSFKQVPHSTRLFLDYLYQFDNVRRFFPRSPLSRDWLDDEVARLHYDPARRQRVAAVLERQNRAWGASQETLDNIARFRAGASAVVTGQQVALFGGPLFSIYKALSAIKLATEFSHAGQECVPVFWLATEDHDLAEVNHVTLPRKRRACSAIPRQPASCARATARARPWAVPSPSCSRACSGIPA
jgi:bacillithiol synthase